MCFNFTFYTFGASTENGGWFHVVLDVDLHPYWIYLLILSFLSFSGRFFGSYTYTNMPFAKGDSMQFISFSCPVTLAVTVNTALHEDSIRTRPCFALHREAGAFGLSPSSMVLAVCLCRKSLWRRQHHPLYLVSWQFLHDFFCIDAFSISVDMIMCFFL